MLDDIIEMKGRLEAKRNLVLQKNGKNAIDGARKKRQNFKENGIKSKQYIHNQKEANIFDT